jgi:hypothetical protein
MYRVWREQGINKTRGVKIEDNIQMDIREMNCLDRGW